MRKLVVGAFVSLDGVMQAPGAVEEDQDGGFDRGGWVVPYLGEEFLAKVQEEVERLGALLLGRKTYDVFAAAWPLRGDDDPVAAKFNSVPKYLVSRTLDNGDWDGTVVLSGDVAEAVAELKRQPGEGEIQVSGSCELVQTLIRHDLVDEYRLKVFPVLLGSGKRLFGDGTLPRDLKLVDTMTTRNGVTMTTYARVGELRQGTYSPELEKLTG